MDERGRRALQDLARAAVRRDLDAVIVEVEQLRREMLALRAASGLPLAPLE